MRRAWPLRVWLPIAIALVLLVAVITSIMGGMAERREQLLLETRSDSRHEISLLAELAQQTQQSNPELLAYSVARFATDPRITAAAVIDPRGKVMHATNQLWRGQDAAALPGFVARQFQQAQQGRVAVINSFERGQTLVAMMSFVAPGREDELRSTNRGVVYLKYDQGGALLAVRNAVLQERLPEIMILLLAVALLIFGIQRILVLPLQGLQRAAQVIADGDFGHRLPLHGPQEIRGLAHAFNQMTEKLVENISRLTHQAHTLQLLLEERELMSQERDRLISVLEATPDLVGIADPQGNVLYMNEAGRRMTGVGQQNLSAMRITRLHPTWAADLILHQAIPAAIRHGVWSGETALLNVQGKEIPISQVIISHLDANGKPQYLSTIIRDITEQKRAEQMALDMNAELERRVALRTQELEVANKELEAFSYSVSHDLRAPLRAVDGFSQLLLEDYADKVDQTGKNYLQRVRLGAQAMGHLIDDLLNLSRVSRAVLQPDEVNLTRLAQEIVAYLREQHPERKVDFKIAENLQGVGDPGLLRVLLENLLGNAWKYTGKTEHAEIVFDSKQLDGETVYCVRDNGAGFDMQFKDKLFRSFQRLHGKDDFEGTGIGLATVARVIRRHGGRIWAEGAVGQGATFCFSLGKVTEFQHAQDTH